MSLLEYPMPSSPDLTPETPWDAAARLGKLDDGTVPEFCPEWVKTPCRVEEWDYAMDTVHPRMYGQCIQCQTVYIFALPRQRQGFRGGYEWGRRIYDRTDLREVSAGAVLGALAAEAGETTFKQSGNAQRLRAMLHEHPLVLRQRMLLELWKSVTAEFRSVNRKREEQVNDLTNALLKRMDEVKTEWFKASRSQYRQSAIAIRDAIAALQRRMTADRKEAAGIRARLNELRAEISTKREAAQREPLPVPADFVPPVLNPGSVLCDRMYPPELIYALIDPADPELVRYVGRTVDPVTRYQSHCNAGTDAVAGWVESVREAGRNPAMVLLERTERETTGPREAYWIHYYRDRFQADLNRSIPKREAVA